jgi:hypothetical protein
MCEAEMPPEIAKAVREFLSGFEREYRARINENRGRRRPATAKAGRIKGDGSLPRGNSPESVILSPATKLP